MLKSTTEPVMERYYHLWLTFYIYINLCSIQTKGIQNAQNGNLQTFPMATARLVFVKGLLIVSTVSSLMSFIK